MKKYSLLLLFCAGLVLHSLAQNVGIGTASPKSSAQLDISSTGKGLLIPRMTSSQRKAISNPEFGLLVFDTDKGTVMFFDGTSWKALSFTAENKMIPQTRPSAEPGTGAQFGSRVAISGNYAVIGAPKYGGSGFANMGIAYLFFKTASGWQQQAKLVARDSAANAFFGGSVAIAGDYAVVGAATKTVGANSSQGKIYVFKRNGTTWVQDTTLTKPTGLASDNFGWSVGATVTSANIPVIAAGIRTSDAGGTDEGEVYVYTRNNSTNTWGFLQSIIPGDLAASDYFGACISMNGDYMAVGATGQAVQGLADAGAVYTYVFGGGVFTFQQKIFFALANSQFGTSISVSGDRMAIGAPGAPASINTSAAVHIFKRTAATWSRTGGYSLTEFEGGSLNMTFGTSVALEGDDLLIGAPGGSISPNGGATVYLTIAGSVYVYKSLDGVSFSRMQVIRSESNDLINMFGVSTGLSNGQYVIGEPRASISNYLQAGMVSFGNMD